MDNEETKILLIQGYNLEPIEEDCMNIKSLIEDFISDYEIHQEESVEVWLAQKMQKELPEKTDDEINKITNDIITSINRLESSKESLKNASAKGISKESWFAGEITKAVSANTTLNTVQYLSNLDEAVQNANDSLTHTIMTQSGSINQNPCLDGYIAEQEHVQSFNMNAAARGSEYRAKVLEPNGSGYNKNGVDIEIVDKNGHVVSRYQCKYCKNSQSTQRAFENGDYRGQQSLVPEDQSSNINRKSTNHIEAPDGTCSNPLGKTESKRIQQEAQSGKFNDKNWNDYKTRDIAIGIGKNVRKASLLGAAVGAITEICGKINNPEKIEVKEIAKKSFECGVDSGIKSALTGALKTASEKGIIKCIPKGTPAGQIANVVFVGVENTKILYKCAKGDIDPYDSMNQIEETTVSAVAGFAASCEGAEIGAAIGSILGPPGAAVGAIIGGSLGYIAGSKIGKTVTKARREIGEKVCGFAHSMSSKIGSTVSSIGNTVSSIGSSIVSALSSVFG